MALSAASIFFIYIYSNHFQICRCGLICYLKSISIRKISKRRTHDFPSAPSKTNTGSSVCASASFSTSSNRVYLKLVSKHLNASLLAFSAQYQNQKDINTCASVCRNVTQCSKLVKWWTWRFFCSVKKNPGMECCGFARVPIH
jgi:hypothetical protein